MAGPAAPYSFKYFCTEPTGMRAFHSHERYEIFYFHGGKAEYLIGDKHFVLKPGDLIIMNGMTLHCPLVNPGDEYARTTLHFDAGHIASLLAPFPSVDVLKPFREYANLRLETSGDERKEVETLLARMAEFYRRRDPVSVNRFLLSMLDLLLLVLRLYENHAEKTGLTSEKERHVRRMIAYVESHYHEDFHLEQLENNLHLSKYYLSKIFKEVTGITLFKYLYRHRINQAKLLFLLDGKKSVTEVSFQVGFKHPAHFSRLFKAQVGCTPEEYRKMQARRTWANHS